MADDTEKKPATNFVDAVSEEMPELVDTPGKRAAFEGKLTKLLSSLGGEKKMLDAAIEADAEIQEENPEKKDWANRAKKTPPSENFRG